MPDIIRDARKALSTSDDALAPGHQSRAAAPHATLRSMVGARIAQARRGAQMKQVDLAVAMGDSMSQSMISMIETGRLLPSFGRATQVAQALGVSLDWIAGLTDDPTPAAELSRLLGRGMTHQGGGDDGHRPVS